MSCTNRFARQADSIAYFPPSRLARLYLSLFRGRPLVEFCRVGLLQFNECFLQAAKLFCVASCNQLLTYLVFRCAHNPRTKTRSPHLMWVCCRYPEAFLHSYLYCSDAPHCSSCSCLSVVSCRLGQAAERRQRQQSVMGGGQRLGGLATAAGSPAERAAAAAEW